MDVGRIARCDGRECSRLLRVGLPFSEQLGDRFLGVGGAAKLPALERELVDHRPLEMAHVVGGRRLTLGKKQCHGAHCLVTKSSERNRCSRSCGSTFTRSGGVLNTLPFGGAMRKNLNLSWIRKSAAFLCNSRSVSSLSTPTHHLRIMRRLGERAIRSRPPRIA